MMTATMELPLTDRDPQIRVTAMPADTNPYGGVFGGWPTMGASLARLSYSRRLCHAHEPDLSPHFQAALRAPSPGTVFLT